MKSTPCNFREVPAAYRYNGGPDGKGWNRLVFGGASYFPDPAARCKLKPLTWQAAMISTTRAHQWRKDYVFFGRCQNECDTCPLLAKHQAKERLAMPTVVRLAENGWLWLMDCPDGGWAEYGKPYRSWTTLLAECDCIVGVQKQDAHSVYYEVS